MKRLISLAMMTLLLLSSLTACDGNSQHEEDPQTRTIAVICPSEEQLSCRFQIEDAMEEMKASFPMDYTVTVCEDDEAYRQAVLSKSQEGCSMIMAVGFQGIDPLDEIADQFPKIQYVILDAVCDNENVKSYAFRSQETAYLIGILSASLGVDAQTPHGPFGAVCTLFGQESFSWRWGYMEGARSVSPELQMDDFLFYYTRNENNRSTARRLALRQASRGCLFIASDCGGANKGIFRAASEADFYTSGQSVSDVDGQNPHILISQLKHLDQAVKLAVTQFFEDGIQSGVVWLGLKEGALDVVFASEEAPDGEPPLPRPAPLTDDIIARIYEVKESIRNGDLSLKVPLEEDYSF